MRYEIYEFSEVDGRQIPGERATVESETRFGVLVLLALLTVAIVANGCAAMAALPLSSMVTSPNASSINIYHNTETRLEQGNFKTIKTNVVGKTSGFALLGFITIVPAKFTKAMSRLYENAALRPGESQTLVNMNLNADSTYLILFSIPRTYVSADVVEFTPARVPENQSRPPPGETPSQPGH